MAWPIFILVAVALSCRGSDSGGGDAEASSDGSVRDSGTAKAAPDRDVSIPEGCVEVTYVVDGDTFHYRDKAEEDKKVRLLGINTREKSQPCYKTARSALASFVRSQYVRLERDPAARDQNENGEDEYGRELRYVSSCKSGDTGEINLQMVRGGWACVIDDYWVDGLALEEALREAERQAANAHAGCWANDSRFCR